jgi:hypothetical protein
MWPFKRKPLPAKDPLDFTLTPSSTRWYTHHYCELCKAWTDHDEWMSQICNSCGGHGDMRGYRSSRKIWNGERWVQQFRYHNGSIELV